MPHFLHLESRTILEIISRVVVDDRMPGRVLNYLKTCDMVTDLFRTNIGHLLSLLTFLPPFFSHIFMEASVPGPRHTHEHKFVFRELTI